MLNNTDIIKEKSLKTFNAQADCYDTTFNGKHSSKIYGMVLEKLSTIKYNSILDIGCGTGNMLSMIPKKDDITFCGLDLSSEMIRVAKKRLNDDVVLKIGDSENLPWDKNTFDVVLCIDSFHHYPKPIKALKEMNRVLKNGGHIIIGDPWFVVILRQVFNFFIKFSDDGDYRIYSKKEITKLLGDCGFVDIDWRRLYMDTFIVTARVNK